MKKHVRIGLIVLLLLAFIGVAVQSLRANDKEGTKKKASVADIAIVKKWEMPDILMEISGIAWMNNGQFACIQDEKGIIFIYSTITGKIEKEVPFGDDGDYEDIVLIGNTAYVQRSDGHIFEVENAVKGKPIVHEYETPLTARQNIEGLAHDSRNNRLLAVVKDKETDGNYKGIYAFDLKTKAMAETPVYKIDAEDELLSGSKQKKKNKSLRPSAIAIHPATGDIWVLEVVDPAILVLDQKNGNIKKLYSIDKADFAQPEGLSLSPDGKIYISNEGVKERANILEVRVNGKK